MQAPGVAQFERSAVPVMGVEAFESLMAADLAGNEHARQLEQILDVVPQHMFILEADGTLSFANRAAREYLGEIEFVSHTQWLTRIIHPEDLASLLQAYRDTTRHGIPVEAEARVRNKAGQYRWFLHQLFPLRDGEGR